MRVVHYNEQVRLNNSVSVTRFSPPVCWFDRFSGSRSVRSPDARALDPDITPPGKKLLCYRCHSIITSESEQVWLNGASVHYRTNLAGIGYRFFSFHTAPGCSISGMPTDEYTWFAGYQWQIASCRQCREHLGWVFTGTDRFFGLISDKLVPAS